MARYSAFLGRRVEVQYRAGDILLPASGTFVADSGRSIFLEQHFEQRGTEKHFRWEIPYQYIVRLEEKPEPPQETPSAASATSPAPAPSAESLSAPVDSKSQNSANTQSFGRWCAWHFTLAKSTQNGLSPSGFAHCLQDSAPAIQLQSTRYKPYIFARVARNRGHPAGGFS